LKQVASQIAGVLVLAASGANTASPDHPMLKSAAEMLDAAEDGLRVARPNERARAHHKSMLSAAADLTIALAAARERLIVDSVLAPLNRAYAHLQSASRALPGFEMVAFDRGCCALPKVFPSAESKRIAS
jgi:hypothetical protein